MDSIDYSALKSPVTLREAREFRRDFAHGVVYSQSQPVVLWSIISVFAVISTSLIVSLFSREYGDSAENYFTLITLGIVLGLFFVTQMFTLHAKWATLLRLSRFAHHNGLEFSAFGPAPGYPGMIFNTGASRRVPARITRVSDPTFDFGNLTYTTGFGKNKKTHHWSYAAVKLDRKLPQIVLDAKANNLLFSNLPSSFSRNQVLSLEGNFDHYFTLYCPQGYERDALYVLTPDLMARLIDEAAGFDIEIVDDWLFFYSGRQRALFDPAELALVFSLIDSVGAKTLDRTERYADSTVSRANLSDGPATALTARMVSNVVAPQGRRLRKNAPLVGVLVAIAIAAIVLINVAFMFTTG